MIGASITYRLGMMGFLGGPTVADVEDIDLNVGLLDQRAGLEWIQRHISQFGGDPSQVTITGESAGGQSVITQMVAFGGKTSTPFKRGIAQSIGYGPLVTEDEAEGAFSEILLNILPLRY